jgi:hypothetical protein
MPETTNWNGSVWGSSSGTVLADLTKDGIRVEGQIQLFEPGYGQLRAKLTGEWSAEGTISANLDQFSGQYAVPVDLPKSGTMAGKFNAAEGIIEGEWSTDTGMGGKLLLVGVEGKPLAPAITPRAAPGAQDALVTKTVVLRSYRFDLQTLRRLVELITQGTKIKEPAINAAVAGREFIHIGVDSLVADSSIPAVIYTIIIQASEPAIQAGTSTLTLTLKQNDPNTLFVSGYDRVWVEGKAAQIEAFLQHHESKAAHFVRNYGAILNSIIFLLMLAFLPSVPFLKERLKVVGVGFVLLTLLNYSWRLAANTKVFIREPPVAWYERHAGWLLVLLEVGLTIFLGYLIKRYITT